MTGKALENANQRDANTYFGNSDAEHLQHPGGVHPEQASQTTERLPTIAEPPAANVRSRPDRQQSIRLRRLRSPTVPSRLPPIPSLPNLGHEAFDRSYRRRSSSEPHQASFPTGTPLAPLPSVYEAPAIVAVSPSPLSQERDSVPGRRCQTVQSNSSRQALAEDCYNSRIVDFLDVVGKCLLSYFVAVVCRMPLKKRI
jgi:hypothetical protein